MNKNINIIYIFIMGPKRKYTNDDNKENKKDRSY